MMTFLNSESACCISSDETASLLKTDLKLGLNNEEIPERRKLYSYNEFEIKSDEPLWLKYLEKVNFFARIYFKIYVFNLILFSQV